VKICRWRSFNIRRAEGPFVLIRDNLKALYTYLCTYIPSHIDYPFTSRDQGAYHKRHRPPENVHCNIPSRVCEKQRPGPPLFSTSQQAYIVWGYIFPPGVNYCPSLVNLVAMLVCGVSTRGVHRYEVEVDSGALPRGLKSWIYSCPENAQQSQARTGYSKHCCQRYTGRKAQRNRQTRSLMSGLKDLAGTCIG
jgi:hypothetical protein